MAETYYSILGVNRGASAGEVKEAWRNLMRQVHPDTIRDASAYVKNLAEARAKEINEAYSVLSNPSLRKRYDQQLDEYLRTSVAGSSSPPQPQAAPSSTPNSQPGSPRQPAPSPARPSAASGSQKPAQRNPIRAIIGMTCILGGLVSAWNLPLASAQDQGTFAMGAVAGFVCAAISYSVEMRAFIARSGILAPQMQLLTAILIVGLAIGIVSGASAAFHTADSADTTGKLSPGATVGNLAGDTKEKINAPPRTQSSIATGVSQPEHRINSISDFKQDLAKRRSLETPQKLPKNPDGSSTADPPSTSKVSASNVAVVMRNSSLEKLCAFGVGSMPCGFGANEEVAVLQKGDVVSVISKRTRAKDGSEITKIKTAQGWEGWVDHASLFFQDARADIPSLPESSAFGNATVLRRASLQKFCAFSAGSMPCGFGAEEQVAMLLDGDRVRIVSKKTRATGGSDIYHAITPQGWDGWIDATDVTPDP